LKRPVAQVQGDVRQGYVTLEAAAEFYGVVLDPESLEVDVAATEKRRVRGSAIGHASDDVKSA
jgi:N-methylhydantoinase B